MIKLSHHSPLSQATHFSLLYILEPQHGTFIFNNTLGALTALHKHELFLLGENSSSMAL